MGYKYNDATMMMATQVAYLNFDGIDEESVGEVVDGILEQYTYIDNEGNRIIDSAANSVAKKQAEVAINIENLSKEVNEIDNWRDWHVVDVCNDQEDTGYYAMLIDTGDGNAIIGCRGSESYSQEQVINDWIIADVGLLDNKLTGQQEMAQKYMEQLYYKYGNEYDTFSLTGHSLGGNLAMHMTITAPAGMRAKIDHCISNDGPGTSQEYLDCHEEAIAKVSGLIDHYQWSWVSSLLITPPGVKDTIIKAHNENYEDTLRAQLFRHDTHNVEYDENGNIMIGEESDLSEMLGPFSRYLEHTGEGGKEDLINRAILLINNSLGFAKIPGVDILFGTVYGIKSVRKIYPKLQEFWETAKNKINDLCYDYIMPDVAESYKVTPQKVLDYGTELETSVKKLKKINEEIASIRRNLQYWSVAGAYYRSRLIILKSAIANNIMALENLHEVLEPCMEKYESADVKVQEKFSLIENAI